MTRDAARPIRPPRARAGFTLVELMMGLAITATVGVAIASMLFAVTRATSDSSDSRRLLIQNRLVTARLDAAVRESRQVLAWNSTYVVLWTSDASGDGQPNRGELRRIEYDAAAHALNAYETVWPGSYTQTDIDSANTSYPLSTDFAALTSGWKGTTLFPAEAWSTAVYGCAFVARTYPGMAGATLLTYTITAQVGAQTGTIVNAVAVRRP